MERDAEERCGKGVTLKFLTVSLNLDTSLSRDYTFLHYKGRIQNKSNPMKISFTKKKKKKAEEQGGKKEEITSNYHLNEVEYVCCLLKKKKNL